jgi:hypothetical protein
MSSKTLRQRVAAVLDDPRLSKINFSLQGANVEGRGFRRVARLVRSGGISVILEPSLGSAGAYNNMKMWFNCSQPEGSAVVHEATHALLDVQNCTGTTDLTNEVAAYLAQTLYIWHKMGESYVRGKVGSQCFVPGSMGSFYAEAVEIIDKHQLTSTCAYLSWSDYQGLREALRADPVYFRPD